MSKPPIDRKTQTHILISNPKRVAPGPKPGPEFMQPMAGDPKEAEMWDILNDHMRRRDYVGEGNTDE